MFKASLKAALLVVACCPFVATSAFSQNLAAPLPHDPAVVTGKLPNGLTYYIKQNSKPTNKVELRLVVKAGSVLETDQQRGLAHFMEHMNFNGTKNFRKNELVSYLQSIGVQFGADLNAYTAFDQTVYILPIPTDRNGNLEKGFQIIEDWAHNATLSDSDIDGERGVVLEESRLGKGANDRMMKQYFPRITQGTIYAERLPIGTDDVLRNFTYDKIRSFYTDWYRPDLQAVIVVGDIAPNEAKKLIVQHFAGLKNPVKEKPRTYATVPPRTMPEAMVVTDKEATNMLLNLQYSYRKNRVSITLADYRNDLVEALALQMLNKRLNDLAEGANPPFAYAGVGMDNLIHGYKAFSAAALPTNNDVQLATSALTGELLKAEQFGFNGSELEIAAKNLQSAYEQAYNERNTTESARLVEEYVGVFLNNDAFPGIANEFAYVKQLLPGIKVAEVNEVVKQWLADKNYFALLTAPENAEIKLPGDKQLLEMMQQGFKQEVVRQADKKVAKTLLETKPAPGTITNVHREDDFGAVTYTLSNGIKVTVKPTVFNTDAIIMKGVKKGGASNYGAADKANVNYTCDIISTMGAGQYTPTQIGEILSGKPVSVSTSINDITSEVDGSSNVKDFESLMQLTYLQLTQPRRDERLFAAFRDKLSSNVKYLRQSPQQAFIDTAVKSICDNHPMVNIVVPNEADVASLSIDRVLSIYSEQFRSADGYHFFIVGNVDTAKIAPLLATYLGSIPATGKQPAYADNGVRVKKGLNRLNFSKGKEKMSMILQVYDAQVPYSEALSMQVNALAEILNIKVIETLREKMGAVYSGGFSAKVSKEPVEKCNLTLYLPCGPENVDTLLAATAAEIEHIKTVGPDYADVEKVKRQWLEKYKTDVKENSYWLGKMVAAFFWDKDRSRIFDYEIYLSKLTPAQIQETARKVFTGNNQFTAILYPEGINKDIKR